MATYVDKPAGLPCPNSSASFWHSEPNAFLMGHRTTKTLPREADIVIIGSGITGASVARYLAADPRSANQSVVMLDAREICWGATGRNGGHCQPLVIDRTPDIAAFEVNNVAAVKSYIEENAVPCEWRVVTACRMFWDQKVFAAVKRAIERLRDEDEAIAKKIRTVSGWEHEELHKIRVKDGVAGVTLLDGALQLWPYKYVTFIIEKLIKEGKLNVQTNTPVTKIETISYEKSTRQKLQTPRGEIVARHVVLATNGYTSHLVHDLQSLIVPRRCEMSALHPPEGSARLSNTYGMAGFRGSNPEHSDYLVQRPYFESPGTGMTRGGQLLFGGGLNYATYPTIGETDDDIIDIGEASYLRRTLLQMLELGGNAADLPELKASHEWTGIKGNSRDNVPWVGRVPRQQGDSWSFEKGLWLCGGYSGHGMPNATLCGKAVVEMILDEEKSGDQNYSSMCESLVSNKDLPRSYLITKERLDAAMAMPTVEQQDRLVGYTNRFLREAMAEDSERLSAKR